MDRARHVLPERKRLQDFLSSRDGRFGITKWTFWYHETDVERLQALLVSQNGHFGITKWKFRYHEMDVLVSRNGRKTAPSGCDIMKWTTYL